MKKVAILLSTYNGAKFLREQLDSLVAQVDVEIILVVRDDGSTKDNTIDILKSYKDRFTNFILLEEPNCGAEESFNSLCRYAYEKVETDYYAFCDQDDVWDSDKLKRAIDMIGNLSFEVPNMYFSNLRMVDEKLNYIRDFYSIGEVKNRVPYALMQIFTYGCTCVFNRVALQKYCSVNNKTYHDNWLFAICSFLGNTIYDNDAHIQYRQHMNNLSRHNDTGFLYNLKRAKELVLSGRKHPYETIARQLLQLNEKFSVSDLKLITRVANYRKNIYNRLYLLFSPKYTTGNFLKDLSLKYRIITNKL